MSPEERINDDSRPLWRNRDFNIFWLIQTLSVGGDSFSFVAIPLLILEATGSVVQMGVVTGLANAAGIAAGVFAGMLVDRKDHRKLLVGCDSARAVLYALIPLIWIFSPQIWVLYIVLPISAALAMIFQITYVAAVPRLVGTAKVTDANGRLEASYALAGVGGPALAGIISAALGPAAAIGIDAATFAVSAVGLCLVKIGRTATATGSGEHETEANGRRWWREFLEGTRFLWRHPVLRTLTVLLSVVTFLIAGLNDILIYHLKENLHQPDGAVGLVLTVAAVGTILGGVLVAAMRRAFGFGFCWIGSYALCGLAVACLGLAASVPVVAVLAAAFMFSTTTAGICSMSLRQEVTPSRLLGRVTSAFWTLHSALGPPGAAIMTAAVAAYGVDATLLLAGAALLIVAVAAAFTPIRLPRPEQIGGETA